MVTLGIIGVVSAMTVPTLMQNYQKRSYVVQLHKVYNELSQALTQFQTDKNALNLREAGLNSQAAIDSFIKSYFKIIQECDTMDECFASEYKKMNGSVLGGYDRAQKSVVLTSGASMRLLYTASGNRVIQIGVDINGQKGPNVQGRDLFWLYVYNNSLIDDTSDDAPLTKDEREALFQSECQSSGGGGGGCFGKILNDNWEMTY